MIRIFRGLPGFLIVTATIIFSFQDYNPKRSSSNSNNVLIDSTNYAMLLEKLNKADKLLLPNSRVLKNGKATYYYRRNRFKKPLSIDEINYLQKNPPDYAYERDFVLKSLQRVNSLGVSIYLTEPGLESYSALWIPIKKILKVNISSLDLGTVEFAKVLNHEMIHMAQSCNSGSLESAPIPFGLNQKLDKETSFYLSHNIYSSLNEEIMKSEIEAYSHQDNLTTGFALINEFCVE